VSSPDQTVGGADLFQIASHNPSGVINSTTLKVTITTASFSAPVGQPFSVEIPVKSEIDARDTRGEPDSLISGREATWSFIEGSL